MIARCPVQAFATLATPCIAEVLRQISSKTRGMCKTGSGGSFCAESNFAMQAGFCIVISNLRRAALSVRKFISAQSGLVLEYKSGKGKQNTVVSFCRKRVSGMLALAEPGDVANCDLELVDSSKR